MYRTFNMGVGMVIIASAPDAEAIRSYLYERGQACYKIGLVNDGNREVAFD